jgi:hypothetical protein
LVPESVAKAQSWPNVAFVAVRDIAASTVAVAWRSDDRRGAVRNFVGLATDLAARSRSGPPIEQAAT